MKKYYLHNGTESSGPFSFDELKAMKIATTTPVWFEGMEKWKYAKDIAELESLIVLNPPPFQVEDVSTTNSEVSKTTTNTVFLGLSRNAFILVLAVILIISTFIITLVQNNRSEELDAQNKKTELENRQFLLQQKEIDAQKKLLEEQEKEAAEQAIKDKKQGLSNRISTIESEIAVLKDSLDTAKEKLAKANDFKIMRTSAEKTEELKKIKQEIDDLETELENLETEQNRLNLEFSALK